MHEHHQSSSAKQARDVVSLGRRCSKTAFPNPDREGCPNVAVLRSMAFRDPRLELNDLPISHVVSCSPCFQEYLRLRRRFVLGRVLQATAASVVVLGALSLAGQFTWNHIRGYGKQNISQQRRPGPRSATHQAPPSVAPLAITINLASFSPTRGAETKDRTKINKIHLPPKLLRINFLLPVGMEPGEYTLRVVDSAGTVVTETVAPGRLKNGITSVEIDLDLTIVSQRRYSLMIRPPGMAWRTFPILVE